MDNKIKKAFSKICVSKDLERTIIMKTVDKRFNKTFKPVYIGLSIILLVVVTTSVVYAKEIKEFLVNTFGKGYVETVDGEKYKVYDENIGVRFNKDNFNTSDRHYGMAKELETDIKSLEEMLGLKVLKYDNAINDKVLYTSIANQNEEVDRIYIRWLDFGGNLNVSLHIKLISFDASSSSKEAFLEELNVQSGKRVIEEYESLQLHTKVLIYEYVDGEEEKGALFTYDNILYELNGFQNVSVDNLKEIVESMSY